MKPRLFFLVKYFLFWIIIFITQKFLFLLYNYKESFDLKLSDWFLVLLHGMKLDMSVAAYFLVIPVLFITIEFLTGLRVFKIVLNFYTYILLFIVLYLGVVDMDLYSYWGFKLDITPLLYLKSPGDAMASVSWIEIVLFSLLFIILFLGFLRLYKKFFSPDFLISGVNPWKMIPVSIMLIFILIIPIRGGFGIVPINLSSVYFHRNRFANHSAINVCWNTLYSLIERKKLNRKTVFFEEKKAEEFYRSLKPENSPAKTKLINGNPNVLLIILEGFSNKIIERLGGEEGITPNLNSLCDSSVLFTNFYANGDRSDKGIISIFSGFPALPTLSIIDYPSKSQELPFLYQPFHESDYNTAFYYGGDLNFANFKAYLSNQYMNDLITINDFPNDVKIQKWGVPDEFVFRRLLDDLDKTNKPFFYSLFTLSSHEPFDAPVELQKRPRGRDESSRIAYKYSDKCIGDFLEEAKKKDWWENTLIILVPDHGSRSPGNTQNCVEEKFKIPMIWTGGAVLKDTIIAKCGSQIDIPSTILSQFNFDHESYVYSKDLLNDSDNTYAFYAFNNGFGFKKDSSLIIYDNDFEEFIHADGADAEQLLNLGKAYLQTVSQAFYNK